MTKENVESFLKARGVQRGTENHSHYSCEPQLQPGGKRCVIVDGRG